MSMNSRLLILAVLFVLAALFVSSLVPASAVLNPYTAVWNTTFAWDGGTKVNVDSATNSCLASGQGIQLNATGKFYGVSKRCLTGSPGISTASIAESYDMSTKAGVPYFDFSGNQVAIYGTALTAISGKFGNAISFDGTSSTLRAYSDAKILLSNFTLASWVYLKNGRAGNPYSPIFGWINGVDYSNRLLVRQDGYTLFQWGGSGTVSWSLDITSFTNGWHAFVLVKTFSTASLYLDGSLISSQAAVGNMNCVSTCNPLSSGKLGIGFDDTGDYYYGYMDDTVVSNRTWSAPEITDFSTAVSTYSTFGSWTSPKVETINATPIAVTLGYRNVSGSESFGPWVSGFSIFNASTGLEFDSPGVMATGTYNVTYFTVSVFSNGSQIVPRGRLNWTLEIDLQGDGNATAQVLFAAILFENLSPVSASPPSDFSLTLVFLVFLIAIAILTIIGLAYEPAFLIMDGIVTLAFAFWVYSQTGILILAGAFVMLGAGFCVMGAVMKPGRGKGNR